MYFSKQVFIAITTLLFAAEYVQAACSNVGPGSPGFTGLTDVNGGCRSGTFCGPGTGQNVFCCDTPACNPEPNCSANNSAQCRTDLAQLNNLLLGGCNWWECILIAGGAVTACTGAITEGGASTYASNIFVIRIVRES
ncbi:hypothetical protein DL95DRAFT_418256 [Leptodontidium sp. 2 PMI_412]|nr:hypothetical protein DL95DRAFT_418256 [Leptodontidium sp. 2 PMI_412]